MRTAIPILLLATACGPQGLVGAWQWDSTITVQEPLGTSMKTVTSKLQFVPATKSPIAWKTGGCELGLNAVGAVGQLAVPDVECALTVVDDIPLASVVSSPQAGDVMIVSSAVFEIVQKEKPVQTNYTFGAGEDGLSMAFAFRIRPNDAPVGSPDGTTYNFKSTTAYAHRVR